MTVERRKGRRERLILKVTIGAASDFVVSYTGDVSARGAFIVTEHPLALGSIIHVEVSFPGLLPPRRLAAVVRWVKGLDTAANDEQPGFGVEWTDVPDDAFLRAVEPPPPAPRRYRVLVVDDDAGVRGMLRAALRNAALADLEIEEADDGAQGLARLARGGIDLMLLDLNIPLLDGHTLLDRVRNDPLTATLPVVVLSAGEGDSRKRSEEGGADFHLDKPLRIVDLLDTVARLLRLHDR